VPREFLDAIAHADHVLQMQSDLSTSEQPEMWMFEVPWALDAHLKEVVRRRKHPEEEEETDWDDDDQFDKNELAEQANWR
jgi:hypothetical protein